MSLVNSKTNLLILIFTTVLTLVLSGVSMPVVWNRNMKLILFSRILLTIDGEEGYTDGIHDPLILGEQSCGTEGVAKGLLLSRNASQVDADAYWQSLLLLCPGNQFVAVRAGDFALVLGLPDLAAQIWGHDARMRDYVLTKTKSTARANDWKTTEMLAAILIKLWPDSHWGYLYHGQALTIQGDWRQAVSDLKQAITLAEKGNVNPVEQAESYQLLGRTYRYQGDYISAKSALMKAVALDPHNSTAFVDLALLEKNRDIQLAYDLAQKALEADSGDVWAYLTLGDIMLEVGNASQAMTLAESAIALQPSSEYPYLLAARSADMLGSVQAAFDYFDTGISRSVTKTNLLCYRLQLANRLDDPVQVSQTRALMSNYGVSVSQCTLSLNSSF